MYLELKKIKIPDTLSFMQLQSYYNRKSEIENIQKTNTSQLVISSIADPHLVNVNNSSFLTINRFK